MRQSESAGEEEGPRAVHMPKVFRRAGGIEIVPFQEAARPRCPWIVQVVVVSQQTPGLIPRRLVFNARESRGIAVVLEKMAEVVLVVIESAASTAAETEHATTVRVRHGQKGGPAR